jgi:exonuclease III
MDIQIATWNVRTMLQPKKMNEIGLEIMKFGISVVSLQEIRWKEHGQINKKDYSLFFSRPKNRTGQLGTGFMINNKMKKT